MRHLIATMLVCVGCANVPAEDDPRASSDFAEDGKCSGTARKCETRPVNACGGGCSVSLGCSSPYVATCAAYTTLQPCDANSVCRWSTGFNQCQPSDICDVWDVQSECAADSDGCVWGQACQGFATSCFEFETSADCTAQGCTWEPG